MTTPRILATRLSLLASAFIALPLGLTACLVDATVDIQADTNGSMTSDTDGDACPDGSPGCPCWPAGECAAGLVCLGDRCVDAGDGSVCGDGLVEAGEECDWGPMNDPSLECTPSCTVQRCGDGYIGYGVGEECDIGRPDAPPECTPMCTLGGAAGCAVLDAGSVPLGFNACWDQLPGFAETLAPSCAPGPVSVSSGVRFFAPVDGDYTVRLSSDAPFSLSVEPDDAMCAAAELTCVEGIFNPMEGRYVAQPTLALAGQAYYVISAASETGDGCFDVEVDDGAGGGGGGDPIRCEDPGLDAYLFPTPVVFPPASTAGTSNDWSGDCGGWDAAELVYRWGSADGGRFAAYLDADFNAALYVRSGSCNAQDLQCRSYPFMNQRTKVAFTAAPNVPQFLFVDGANSSFDKGTFQLTIGDTQSCLTGQSLGLTAPASIAPTAGVLDEVPFDGCGIVGGSTEPVVGAIQEVSFSASGIYRARMTAPEPALLPGLAVLRGDCVDTVQPQCGSLSFDGLLWAQEATFVAGAGEELIVMAANSNDALPFGTPIPLDFELIAACPETDLGTTASVATGGDTSGADARLVGSCAPSNGPERTFQFTAPVAGQYEFTTAGTAAFDTVLYLFDGASCGGPELACNDDAPGLAGASLVTADLSAGQTVTVVVDALNGSGPFNLSIQLL